MRFVLAAFEPMEKAPQAVEPLVWGAFDDGLLLLRCELVIRFVGGHAEAVGHGQEVLQS